MLKKRGAAPFLLDNHLDEMHFAKDWPGHNERVVVMLAHAASQFVQDGGQLNPGIDQQDDALRIGRGGVIEILNAERLVDLLDVFALKSEP